jgi:signal transduction histidine kinase
MNPLAQSLVSAKSLFVSGASRIGRLNLRSRWIWVSTLYLQVASLFTYDLARRETVNPNAALIIVLSFVSYWLLYPILIAIVDRVASRVRWAWVGFGLLILGTSRGFLLEHLYVDTSAEAFSNFLDRAPGDITIALITLIAMSELMYSTKRHVTAMSQLTIANASLMENRKATGSKASDTEANLRQLAQSSLLGELDRIKSLVGKANQWNEIKSLADEIRNLITSEVRPLSRKLRDRIDSITNTKELRVVKKPLRFGRPNTVSVYLDTRIVGTYLLSMPNILVTIYSLSNLEATALAFAASLAVFPIGLALRKIFASVPPRSRLLNWLATNATLVLAYLPLQLTTVHLITLHPDLQPLRSSGIGVFLFVGLAITLWRAIERSRAQIETELSDLNLDLVRSTAIVEQQVWIAQKKWAYLVHGTVQGALTVAASRLQLANEDSPVEAKQILRDLDKAVAALKGDFSQEQSFSQQVKETKDTWAGVLDLEIAVDKSAKPLMDNPITARCASEIVKELAGNAYRHGKAKRVLVALSKNADGDLILSASNDGKPLGVEDPGLGSDLFTDLTMRWSFSNDSQGVNFEAVLPGIYPLSESSQA